MRRALLLAASTIVLLGAGYAVAAAFTITLTAAGPQPALATIAWGDTVTFSNADARAYQVTIPRATVQSPEIPPGGTFEHVFNGQRGNYGYRQLGGSANRPGTIVVELKGTVTLAAKPEIVAWGGTIRFTGRSPFPGLPVNLKSFPAGGGGGDWTQVETTTAAADGAFAFAVKPKAGARYRAQVAADQLHSAAVLVLIKPVIAARALAGRTKTGRTVTITARITPAKAASMVDLERFDARRNRWGSELRSRVSSSGRATFRWKALEGKSRLRVAVLRSSVTQGWAPSASPPVIVTGVGKPPSRRG